jgi:hypothetical protein
MEARREPSLADELVGRLLPENLEWEALVRAYPLPSLAVAALGGFVLGRTRGAAVVAAFSAFAAAAVSRAVNELVGDEVI